MFPEAASRAATEVDALSLTLLGMTTLFSLGIASAILFFMVRYWHNRDVNRNFSHSRWLQWTVELSWSLGPLMILLAFFMWGAVIYVRANQPPANALNVYVVAKQWMWKLSHEGGQREINSLHVPTGRPVRLTMISEDVIHSFYVPAFRTKRDVLPGRYSSLWFEPTRPGVYHLFCAEYCGTDHSRMIGKVIVQTPEEFARWQADQNTESLAQRGRRQVEASGCLQCHGRRDGPIVGPPLTGLYDRRVPLDGGEFVMADDAYLRRAILNPKSQVHAGFSNLMPSFEGQLTAEQILEITAYIRSIADATGPLAGPGFDDNHTSIPPNDPVREDTTPGESKSSKVESP